MFIRTISLITLIVLGLTIAVCAPPDPGNESSTALNSDDNNKSDFPDWGKVMIGAAIIAVAAVAITWALFRDASSDFEFDPNFFVCKYWKDKDHDGREDPNEYIGINDSFKSKDKITIVARIIGKSGAVMKTDIYKNYRELIHTDLFDINLESTIRKISFDSQELYNLGGGGQYTVKWSLNDEPVSEFNFVLSN